MTQYRQIISMYTRGSKRSDTGSLFRQFNNAYQNYSYDIHIYAQGSVFKECLSSI